MITHIYPSVLQAVSRRGYAVCLERVILGYRGGAMQDLGYELPRIPIPRTPVNKGKNENLAISSRGAEKPEPRVCVSESATRRSCDSWSSSHR
jgi:hypothetical protein